MGIIGHPLSHSLSNVMQQAALKTSGLEGTYEVLDTPSEDLITRVKMLKIQGYNGFNVTIPLKVPITLFLEQFDEYANLSGAVNTVKILDDRTLYGYNTDVWGFINSLPKDFVLTGKKAAVLGTGGASRAICTALKTLGVRQIDLYTRNVVDSHDTIEGFRNKFKDVEIKLFQNEFMEDLSEYKIVINTTPLGMKNFAQQLSPIKEEVIKTLDDNSMIYDIVYNPPKTELLKLCEKHNKQYKSGIDMLVLQGARAFEIWTGVMPDINAMKIAVLENFI